MEERNTWKRCSCGRQQAVLPFYMTYPMPDQIAGQLQGQLPMQSPIQSPIQSQGQLPLQWNFGSWEEEDAAMRDLEYMIQMYPKQARKYQEKISRMLDTMDYQGSVIYDEYPDRLALSRMSDHVYEEVRTEEALEEENQFIRELILILLYYEIFRRRRGMYSGGAGSYGRMNGNLRWPQMNSGNPWNMY